MLLEDFNAQVGKEPLYKPATIGGESAYDISSGNRIKFIEYVKNLIITCIFFLRKLI